MGFSNVCSKRVANSQSQMSYEEEESSDLDDLLADLSSEEEE